ncbi:Iron dicitrate transport regulator FecR [Bordetella sputigena]|uniref:FecR family protein n=1 Tax=Bordetella sputigena TaxID=1416810 RepID=UPI0039EDEB01
MNRTTGQRALYAGGIPLEPSIAEEAARWYVLFSSGQATDKDRQAWIAWCAADADHQRAWAQLAYADDRMNAIRGRPAYEALSRARRKNTRRRLLRGAAGLLALGAPALWLADRMRFLRITPDYAAAIGTRREVVLRDDSRIVLNSGSGIDVNFDESGRVVTLRQGEAYFTTGHAAAYARMPFQVRTAAGTIRALGTRFNIRLDDDHATVAVYEGQVSLHPARGGESGYLAAGNQATLFHGGLGSVRPVAAGADAWLQGRIAADNVSLAEFLAELSRYRRGYITCDDAAGRMRLSGLFPTDDTDRVLEAISGLLPIAITRRTPYWVEVSARRAA